MKGIELFNLGYRDLVSVVPPGATISPNSSLRPEYLGKTPGKKGARGWYGYNFVGEAAPTREQVLQYDAWGANIGIMARRFPAVDIDVQSAELSDMIRQIALTVLGPAPTRLSRNPRVLLMYAASEPFTRMQLAITYQGESHLVEVLAGERQYLIAGTHPSGNEYRWMEPLPPAYGLYTINREKALTFLQTVAAELKEAGASCELIGTGEDRQKHAPPQDELLAPSIEELRQLVSALPNDELTAPTWDDWIKVGHAIKAAAGDDPIGEELFLDWTDRCTRVSPASPEEAASQYARMRAPHRVGWGWLESLASDAGVHDTAASDFAAFVDPNAQPPQKAVALPDNLNDEAIVTYLLPRLSERLRYLPNLKGWYWWDGHLWRRDDLKRGERIIREELKRFTELLRQQATGVPKQQAILLRRSADLYQNRPKIENIIQLAKAELAATPAHFDTDKWLLNTPTGVVDLRTGNVSVSTPSGMHSRSTKVGPRQGPKPLFDGFMRDLTEGNAELLTYFKRMFGYMLTGDMREKSLWYVWGGHDTGKSTLIRVLVELFDSYGGTADPKVWMHRRGDHIPAELAKMPGVRLVTSAEPKDGMSWNESLVKSITGGDSVDARFLYGQPFSYYPQFKLLLVGNNEPTITNLDGAMMRRIHIVPANNYVPEEKRIFDLSERIVREEGSAVLHWMIEGCLEWQRHGLSTPRVVLERTADYIENEDTVGQWVREHCEINSEAETSTHELYLNWASWCRVRGEEPGPEKAFKRKFSPTALKHGIKDRLVGSRRLSGWRGIRLRSAIGEQQEAMA